MDYGKTFVPSAFDTLFGKNVPHILEIIFFSLDYNSYNSCMRVNRTWRGLFGTARYSEKLDEKLIEKKIYERKLFDASRKGNAEEVKRHINAHMLTVNFRMPICDSGMVWYGIPYDTESTPLIGACAEGHNEVVQVLLDAGADVNMGDSSGNTPLMFAGKSGQVKCVNLLLGAGAIVDKANTYGRTPLWCTWDEEVAKSLIDNGANPNAMDRVGDTPLHAAVMMGYKNVMKTLIQSGADIDRNNNDGVSPLVMARMMSKRGNRTPIEAITRIMTSMEQTP